MKTPPIDPWLLELNSLLKENDDLYRSAARRLGVPETALWILYSLRTWPPPVTQTSLCQWMHQPKQTINSALKHMEAQGLIQLSPGGDRRTREILLTEAGAALAERTADQVVQAEERALAGLGPQERESFLLIYRKFNRLIRQAMSQWNSL